MQLGKRTFIIYPGRFHPFHKGHKGVFDYLTTKYSGNDVYITTTDKVELPKSPFTFEEKKKMMMLTGIPLEKIINVRQNYNLENLVGKIPINIDRDFVIFALSEKDMAEDPRFAKFTKKDGSPTYLQPLPKNLAKLEPAIKHGYIDTVPTTDFTVLGMPARSASQLRDQYSKLDISQRKKFIIDLFGKFDQEVFDIMNNKLSGQLSEGLTELQKEKLKKIILGMMSEDQSRVDAARKQANLSFKKQREEEYRNARESLKDAEERLRNAPSEQIESLKQEVDNLKKAVDRAKKLYDAAILQAKT